MVVLIPRRRADGKLVFRACIYGPSESARKTVLKWIYGKEGLAISNVIFQVYTYSVADESKARNFLKGADSILFIWDSLIEKWENNISSLKTLLHYYGDKLISRNPDESPDISMVVLADNRDREYIVEISKIRKVLDIGHLDHTLIYETTAIQGINIKRAFVYAARQAVLNHYKMLAGESMESRLNNITKIKKLILELGIKFTRLEIREIGEKSNIDDENMIIDVVKDMIKNKEIYAEYFKSSKAIAFNQQANIDEIDKLMATYKEWEEKEVGKK